MMMTKTYFDIEFFDIVDENDETISDVESINGLSGDDNYNNRVSYNEKNSLSILIQLFSNIKDFSYKSYNCCFIDKAVPVSFIQMVQSSSLNEDELDVPDVTIEEQIEEFLFRQSFKFRKWFAAHEEIILTTFNYYLIEVCTLAEWIQYSFANSSSDCSCFEINGATLK